MSADLKASCKQVLQRLQQQDVAEFTCVLCSQLVRGQDALMQHLITEHSVHCTHFDNVADLPRLLQHLTERLHSGTSPASWSCPVCGDDTQSSEVAVLLQHLQANDHAHWTAATIPSISAYCITVADSTPADAAASPKVGFASKNGDAAADDDDDDAAWENMDDEEVDEDEDWNTDCVCLYCDYAGEDILDHLKAAHDVDFGSAVRQRTDVKDEYDLIRIVNAVRRAVAADRCPHGEGCAVDGRENDRAALEAHLVAVKEHRLPAHVSASDADLIPVLPGDAFISMLVTSGAGFLAAEEEDPDFPMVPTVQEFAAAARDKAKK